MTDDEWDSSLSLNQGVDTQEVKGAKNTVRKESAWYCAQYSHSLLQPAFSTVSTQQLTTYFSPSPLGFFRNRPELDVVLLVLDVANDIDTWRVAPGNLAPRELRLESCAWT